MNTESREAFEYTGRDSEGRPTFDYSEVCDEY